MEIAPKRDVTSTRVEYVCVRVCVLATKQERGIKNALTNSSSNIYSVARLGQAIRQLLTQLFGTWLMLSWFEASYTQLST